MIISFVVMMMGMTLLYSKTVAAMVNVMAMVIVVNKEGAFKGGLC